MKKTHLIKAGATYESIEVLLQAIEQWIASNHDKATIDESVLFKLETAMVLQWKFSEKLGEARGTAGGVMIKLSPGQIHFLVNVLPPVEDWGQVFLNSIEPFSLISMNKTQPQGLLPNHTIPI